MTVIVLIHQGKAYTLQPQTEAEAATNDTCAGCALNGVECANKSPEADCIDAVPLVWKEAAR